MNPANKSATNNQMEIDTPQPAAGAQGQQLSQQQQKQLLEQFNQQQKQIQQQQEQLQHFQNELKKAQEATSNTELSSNTGLSSEERILQMMKTKREKVATAMELFENTLYDVMTKDLDVMHKLSDTTQQMRANRDEASLESHINTAIDCIVDITRTQAKKTQTVKSVPHNAQSIGLYDRLKLLEGCYQSMDASIKKTRKMQMSLATKLNRRQNN
jgi:chromosome segregation ATPase